VNSFHITGKLKQLLEQEIGVPASKQNLCGWVSKHDRKVSDEVCSH